MDCSAGDLGGPATTGGHLPSIRPGAAGARSLPGAAGSDVTQGLVDRFQYRDLAVEGGDLQRPHGRRVRGDHPQRGALAGLLVRTVLARSPGARM